MAFADKFLMLSKRFYTRIFFIWISSDRADVEFVTALPGCHRNQSKRHETMQKRHSTLYNCNRQANCNNVGMFVSIYKIYIYICMHVCMRGCRQIIYTGRQSARHSRQCEHMHTYIHATVIFEVYQKKI